MARNLEQKSIEELQQLASNEIALIEMVSIDDSLKSVQTEVQTAQENNKMLAEENTIYANDKIPSLRNQLNELYKSINNASENLNNLSAQYNSLTCGPAASNDLADQLKINAAEADETSEKIAENFLEKEIDLDGFLNKYKDARKKAHIARINAEKFTEIMEQERIKRQQQNNLMQSVGQSNYWLPQQQHQSASNYSLTGQPPPALSNPTFNPYMNNHSNSAAPYPYSANVAPSAYP